MALACRTVALLTAGLAGAVTLAAAPAQTASADEERRRHVEVQLLGLNDFHGNLEPPAGSGGVVETAAGPVPAGGAEYLATLLRRLRVGEHNSFVVHQGHMIGASPSVSAAFKDEPTIEFLNSRRTTAGAAGNHEFDEGVAELLRIQHGGCHPTKGCYDEDGYAGADFTYLAGNVVNAANGRRPFPAYAIRRIGGQRIGFVGMPLEGTLEIVEPRGGAHHRRHCPGAGAVGGVAAGEPDRRRAGGGDRGGAGALRADEPGRRTSGSDLRLQPGGRGRRGGDVRRGVHGPAVQQRADHHDPDRPAARRAARAAVAAPARRRGASSDPAPSEALRYTWRESAPVGDKVSGITVADTPVTDAGTYRLTVNSFLAAGAHGFTVLREGTDRVVGDLDLDAFTDYLGARSPVPPPATDRVTRVP